MTGYVLLSPAQPLTLTPYDLLLGTDFRQGFLLDRCASVYAFARSIRATSICLRSIDSDRPMVIRTIHEEVHSSREALYFPPHSISFTAAKNL